MDMILTRQGLYVAKEMLNMGGIQEGLEPWNLSSP